MNDFGDTDTLLEHEGDDERNIRKQKKKQIIRKQIIIQLQGHQVKKFQ